MRVRMKRQPRSPMAAPLDKSILCPRPIGRAPYLDALNQSIEQARGGRGQIVLLAGETGIGKSRLVTEAKTYAAGLGMLILEGRRFEPDRTLPYAPLLDLLRAQGYARAPDELRRDFGPAAQDLVRLLPELRAILDAYRRAQRQLHSPRAPAQTAHEHAAAHPELSDLVGAVEVAAYRPEPPDDEIVRKAKHWRRP